MTSTYTHTAMITIKPGETTKVQLGGVGRPLIGKLSIPKDAASKGWNISGGMSTKQPDPPTPKDFEELTEEQQREWWKKYAETPEYKAQQRNTRHFNFQVAEDGTFKMEDVPPGKYQLYFNAQDQSTQQWDQVAMGQGEATVAEIPGGFTDQPQDLGTFELRPIKKLQVGDALPAITTPVDLDGKPIKLEDYKGKLLLLHFWASNHQPSTVDMLKLKELYEAFGKDGRLVMVGFNFDRTAEMAKSYVAKNEIKWPQAYSPKANLYQELGLRNFPAYMLFGPDGKLIAKDMPGDQLKGEVEKALKK
jgi:peroxiredoxin